MRFITKITIASFVLFAGFALTPLAADVSAVDVTSRACQGAGQGSPLCESAGSDQLPTFIKTIVNLLLAVLGFIAVIMIIIGGIRYTTSNGDSNQTKAAKDTVLYAVVGLVVAILAYAIVNFVVDFFISGP